MAYRSLYVDASQYYFCYTSNNADIAFKMSVLRRYMRAIVKKDGILWFFPKKQYLSSLGAFMGCFYASLFFPFKRRIRLHGLAFNVDFDNTARHLTLNAGLTQAPILHLPSFVESIMVSKSRRKVSFESRVRELVSNFVAVLRDIRPLGVYHNPAKRGGRRGIRIHLTKVRVKKFNKDVK